MYYRKIKSGRWLFEIQKIGYPRLSKSFEDLRIGKKWARKIENAIELGSYEDLTLASKTTIKSLLIKYRDEITLNKKGHREERSKLNLLIKNEIATHTITQLKAHHLYKLKKQFSETRAPATVNKYIHILHNVWNTADEFKKEFLGEIPINPDVGKFGDKGKPIVEENSDHEISEIYLDFAEKIKLIFFRT